MPGSAFPSRVQGVLVAAAAAFWTITTVLFFRFTVDDAWIVARYAVNARDYGEWAFNPGEHVTALTSPLHGMLMVLLAHVAADPVPLYKLIAIALSAGALVLGATTVGIRRSETLLFVAIVVGPGITLWTSAGLETPMLAAIVTALATAYSVVKAGARRSLLVVAGLAGLAVLTRYDAILFAGPVLLAALVRARASGLTNLIALALAAAPMLMWFAYSWHHFGAILPTSFYVKQPTAAGAVVVANIRYMLEHLVICGIVVAAAYVAARVFRSRRPTRTLFEEARSRWGLYAGLAVVLAYGATMATAHMMFAFRHFVPYLPAAALTLTLLLRRAEADQATPATSVSSKRALEGIVVLVLAVHGVQADALYGRSLQGLGLSGEYEAVGTAGYTDAFVPAMRRNAEDAKRHWEQLNIGRTPRIWTFAAGVLPYSFQDAFIYENLVSFRHNCVRDWKVFADYIHVFTRHGSLSRQLIRVERDNIRLVSEQRIRFNGADESLLVYHNRVALENRLPPWVDQPCLPEPR